MKKKRFLLFTMLALCFTLMCGFISVKRDVIDPENTVTEAGNVVENSDTQAGDNNGDNTQNTESNNGQEGFTVNGDGDISINTNDVITNPNDMYPKVEPEGFFQRLYNKMFQATNAFQKVIAILLIIIFVICVFMTAASAMSPKKEKVVGYLIGALICLIALVVDLSAVPIMNAFNSWFKS